MTFTVDPAGATSVPAGIIASPFARATVEIRFEPRAPVGVADQPPSLAPDLDPGELELPAGTPDVLGQRGRHLRAEQMRPAHHLEDRRPEEHLQAHEHAHRVARQPEVRLPLDVAEPLRHPRLHRHLVEVHVTAPEERGLDDVALPHGHAARRDERVGLDLEAEDRLAERLDVVAHDPRHHRHRAHLPERAEDQRRVRVPHLPERRRLRRRHELVAGRQHDDPWARVYERCRVTGDREEAELGSAEALARRDEDVAFADVLAVRADVRARRAGPSSNRTSSSSSTDAFSIGTTASAPAGIGAPVAMCIASPAPTVALGLVADQRATDDLQLGRRRRSGVGDVGGAHREPVHRGGCELGEVDASRRCPRPPRSRTRR